MICALRIAAKKRKPAEMLIRSAAQYSVIRAAADPGLAGIGNKATAFKHSLQLKQEGADGNDAGKARA
jgi:hypothetical protein